jgi:hypothetical protein
MPAQPQVQNYNTQQIFLGNNWDVDETFTNGTGAAITVLAGTVMGTIFGAGIATCQSGNTDGSQYPKGFCRETTIIPANGTGVVNLVYSGEVNSNAIIFANGTDTLATTVGAEGTNGGSMADLIRMNTQCKLIASTDLTIQDPNQ